ncbi:MAG: TonB-dependent receptor plug domain-containing protein [Opitutaceae bacterium]|nr:TonB-dependent receptor plug domain-containing protein [Opitutaceae bacterium]
MKTARLRPSLFLAALAAALVARAQTAADPAIALDEITVSATRIAQPVADVPASVTVLRLNDLLNPVANLRDLARGEPGVSVPAAFGATGNAPRNFPAARSVNIRGLDGNRVLIQIDGVRQPEQFTFGNAQLIGRDYFEPSLYRTAEILKGSASALYGSDAVGGVLSFISPAPTALLAGAKRDWLGGVSSSYASATRSGRTRRAARRGPAWCRPWRRPRIAKATRPSPTARFPRIPRASKLTRGFSARTSRRPRTTCCFSPPRRSRRRRRRRFPVS